MSERAHPTSESNEHAEIASPEICATTAAPVTAPGRGAIAVIQVHGPRAADAVAKLCRRDAESFARDATNGRLWIGHWRTSCGEPVVVRVCRSDLIEISCHGGTMPMQTVFADLAELGIQPASAAELLRRACATTIESEALAALSEAPTLRTAEILVAQYRGALARAVREIHECLMQGCAADAAERIEQLLVRAAVGLHLVTPWRVAIVGRPNVGKSSLLNALVGFDRAIVHATPGTTRDLVTATTAIDGWPVELIDSAGLRATADALESAGIDRARRAIEDSDLQLVVLDRSRPLAGDDSAILRSCPTPIVVINKIDLPPAWQDVGALRDTAVGSTPLVASARTGQCLDRVIEAIGQRLVPNPPRATDAVPFNARLVAGLRHARELVRANALSAAMESMNDFVKPT